MTSANTVIVNRNIPKHQFRLSIRWEAAYANRLLITGTVSYSNTYIVPMGTFCGSLIFPGMVRDFCNELIDNRHIPPTPVSTSPQDGKQRMPFGI